jgi:alpha-tubulin suppressor-like RCC1 family protein
MRCCPRVRTCALLVGVIALAGCGGAGTEPPAPVNSVTVLPNQPTVGLGDTLQLSTTLRGATGTTLRGRAVEWASDNPDIASVSAAGLVTGEAPGTTSIVATSEGQSGSVTLEVHIMPGHAASVEVSGLDATTPVGRSVQLAATARDAGGVVLTGRTVTWTSSSAGATVDANGLATIVSAGPVSITATADGVHAAATTTGLVRFTSIASGLEHTCALTPDGDAYCWGLNNVGQLGDGTQTNADAPVRVVGGNHFVKIVAAGGTSLSHSCALTTSGLVYCWGSNAGGELGRLGPLFSAEPQPVSGELRFEDIAVGELFTCGVTTAADAYCWGTGSFGELGDGGVLHMYMAPHLVVGGRKFVAITAGRNHVCGLSADGAAWCWGHNANGQLGSGDLQSRLEPSAVQAGVLYTQISADGAYTCGISQAGRAFCWGFNTGGQLGVGDQVDRPFPTAVSGDLTLTAITTGDAETCALAGDATAYCWGGYVGAPSPTLTLTPVAIPGGLAWSGISGAEKGACGIAAGPVAYCWGADDTGQAGNGPAPASLTPARVLYQP